MKKILLLLLLPLTVAANPIDDKCPQFTPQGAPVSKLTGTQYLCKQQYAIHYRYDTKTAEYVVEHVTKEAIHGSFQRQNDFHADTEIPEQFRSTPHDYTGHPYDKGHLVPAGDSTQSKEVMSESFSMANMIPQVPAHNRGVWNHLEALVRSWVDDGKDLYVASGTYYQAGNSKKFVAKGVQVPDYLWKVIYDASSNKTIALLIPNDGIPVKELPRYIISVSQLQEMIGIDFHPKLGTTPIEESVDRTAWKGL